MQFTTKDGRTLDLTAENIEAEAPHVAAQLRQKAQAQTQAERDAQRVLDTARNSGLDV